MSRIGKKPVSIPGEVKAAVSGQTVRVEGPKGQLERTFPVDVRLELDDATQQLHVRSERTDRQGKSLHGLTRALIQNMIIGVKDGYEKRLQIVGVGYLAAIQGDRLQLRVGYANEVQKPIPEGLNVTCPDQTHVVVRGCDKQLVGQFAAEVRAVRKPEPYKGKGVRYEGEYIKIKPGKAAS